MTQIRVYADYHLYGPHALSSKRHPDLYGAVYDANAYLLGDNIEIYHCRDRDLVNARATLAWFLDEMGDHFISGNHELMHGSAFRKVGNTLLTHGDHLFWGWATAHLYRSRRPHISFAQRWISISAFDFLRHVFQPTITRAFLERAASTAHSWGCTMIVCAHRHPTKVIETCFGGIKIVVVPRGRTLVEIDD